MSWSARPHRQHIHGSLMAAGAVPFVLTDASVTPVNKLVLFASYAASCGLFGIVLRYGQYS